MIFEPMKFAYVAATFTLLSSACNAASIGQPLYEAGDSVIILNESTFESTLLNSNHSFFLVQFYNSWCGHCIRYAPDFKQYAKDVAGWQPVIDIAVVNCADDENIKLCRQYVESGFPTLKLFWIDKLSGGRKINATDSESRAPRALRKSVINFIEEKIQGGHVRKNVPRLTASSVTTIDQLWSSVPSKVSVIFVVIEDEESMIGRESILDFSGIEEAKVFRFIRGQGPPELKDKDAISLFRLDRGVHPRLLETESDEAKARAKFIKAFQDNGFSFRKGRETLRKPNSTQTGPINIDFTKIYVDDIEAAIYNTLHSEVALQPLLDSGELKVLSHFVKMILDNVELPPRILSYMRTLHDKFSTTSTMTGDEYLTFLNQAETSSSYLRKNLDYRACQGSEVGKRGYTCGLWMLFHSITTGSYSQYRNNLQKTPQEVLYGIRDYIANFFSCSECKNHFAEMAKTIEEEVSKPEDTVLWLWKAHNKVNNRTKNTPSEDVKFPKVHFPSKSYCPTCYDQSFLSESKVLEYLLKHYSRDNLIVDNEADRPKSDALRATDSASGMSSGLLSNFDFTLFLVIYAVSITLLFVVFVSIVCKRRKDEKEPTV